MLPGTEAVHLERERLEVVFGRAFLVALGRNDHEKTMVFARALLTNFTNESPQPR